MTNLLCMQTWLMWTLIAIGGVIVGAIVMSLINRQFRIKYDLNLFYGGFLMLLAEAGIIGGIFLYTKADSKLGFVLIGVGAILVIITLIYDIKKCGGIGVLALFLQAIFSIGCLFFFFDLLGNHGISSMANTNHSIRESRRVREERERRGYNKRDPYDGNF